MSDTKIGLYYHGGEHEGSLDNVPARDLSNEEVERFGGKKALLASGLYSVDKPEREPRHVRDEAAVAEAIAASSIVKTDASGQPGSIVEGDAPALKSSAKSAKGKGE